MAAKETSTLPAGPNWTYEVKWDGFRVLLVKRGDKVRLVSRNDKDLTAEFPLIAAATKALKARSVTIDGELVALTEDGRPSFQALQNRSSAPANIVYYAFDLLELNGKPSLHETLDSRRAKLERSIAGTALKLSISLKGEPGTIIENVAKLGLEGVVAKRRDSRYEPGQRTGAWQKLKLSPEQEFVVGGFRPNGRGVESLLIGYYEGKALLWAASVRQGLNPRNRVHLSELLAPHVTEQCPFENLPTARKGRFGNGITAAEMNEFRWVKPKIVVQVAFVEWTRNLQLRHSAYKGIRQDKKPHDVRKKRDRVRQVALMENDPSTTRPSVLFRPRLFVDGNRWCALYGEDLQSGLAGFGDTPKKAMDAFDYAWQTLKPGRPAMAPATKSAAGLLAKRQNAAPTRAEP